MRHIVIPTVIASLIGSIVSGAVSYSTKPSNTIVVQRADPGAPGKSLDAKAVAAARSVWPDLSQEEVDGITAALKAGGAPGRKVTVFCERETICGDLSLSIENAYESARWPIDTVTSAMVLPGFLTSSQQLADFINGKTAGRYGASYSKDVEAQSGGEDVISIGRKPKG